MININGTTYKLGLLDTCVIGRILLNSKHERDNFFNIVFNKNITIIPCITIWTILELRRKPELYKIFLDFFSVFPFCLIKTPDLILSEEFKFYPDFTKVDPILFTFSSVRKPDESLEKFLEMVFEKEKVIFSERMWKQKWKKDVLDSLLDLKKNFKPKGKFYNSHDAKEFVELGVPQYLAGQNPDWIEKKLTNNLAVNPNAFPSVKISFYTVFYRFYVARRKPELQDIFDISINNPIPYLDFVLTEKFQADIFHKVQNIDSFINNLEVKTIRDLI